MHSMQPSHRSCSSPGPGGLTFDETTDLVRGIALKEPIVGFNLFEVRPELDTNNLTTSTIAQLVINFSGTLAHSVKLADGSN